MSQIFKAVTSGSLPPSVAQSFITSPATGTAVPAAGVLTFVNGNGIVFSASGSSVTASVINDGFPWTDEADSFPAFSQNGYFCTGTLTARLPVTAGLANGATVIIYVDSASAVTVQAQADQFIQVGHEDSVVGGKTISTALGSTLTLSFRIADTTWHTISSLGTWTTT